MNAGPLRSYLEREVHVTWKHVALCGLPVIAMLIGTTTSTAVNATRLDEHQRIIESRAPAVAELARVAQELKSEAKASDQFRGEMREDIKDIKATQRRLEEKLDKVLQQ